jgi:hypothetical protein
MNFMIRQVRALPCDARGGPASSREWASKVARRVVSGAHRHADGTCGCIWLLDATRTLARNDGFRMAWAGRAQRRSAERENRAVSHLIFPFPWTGDGLSRVWPRWNSVTPIELWKQGVEFRRA